MKLLVKYNDNWADEFDLEGFKLIDKVEWDKHVEDTKKFVWPQSCYFGTNEDVEWGSRKEYLNSYKVKELNKNESHVLEGLLGNEFGLFIHLEDDPECYSEPHERG